MFARVGTNHRYGSQNANTYSDDGEPMATFSLGVAVVLYTDHHSADTVISVLKKAGTTTLSRPFDELAVPIVRETRPRLAVLVCDPSESADAEMIVRIAAEPVGRVLVVDIQRSPAKSWAALELGADAVLTIFDDARTVRATLGALFRHSEVVPPQVGRDGKVVPMASLKFEGLRIDADRFEVHDCGELIHLTRTEFLILSDLAAHAGTLRSPMELMSSIHPFEYDEPDAQQAVKVFVRRLRLKLALCSSRSVEIVNTRSHGYRLQRLGRTSAA